MNSRIAKKILKAQPEGRHHLHQINQAKARLKKHHRLMTAVVVAM